MKAKKWTVRYATEDGGKYASVIGNDLLKVIAYFSRELGINPNTIDYMCADECTVVE